MNATNWKVNAYPVVNVYPIHSAWCSVTSSTIIFMLQLFKSFTACWQEVKIDANDSRLLSGSNTPSFTLHYTVFPRIQCIHSPPNDSGPRHQEWGSRISSTQYPDWSTETHCCRKAQGHASETGAKEITRILSYF